VSGGIRFDRSDDGRALPKKVTLSALTILPPARSRRGRAGLLRLPGAYLLGFLLAAAASPHRHADGVADLVSGGPSDSGSWVELARRDAETAAGVPRAVDDDPCIACFANDYVFAPAVAAAILYAPVGECGTFASDHPGSRFAPLRETASRSPPRPGGHRS
jgi:hypothetical protein